MGDSQTTKAAETTRVQHKMEERPPPERVDASRAFAEATLFRAAASDDPTTPPQHLARVLRRLTATHQTGFLLRCQRHYGNAYVQRMVSSRDNGHSSLLEQEEPIARQVTALQSGRAPDGVATAHAEQAASLGGPENIAVQTKPLALLITPNVQRQKEKDDEENKPLQSKSAESLVGSFDAGEEVEARLSQSKGRGSPLPESVRAYMEPRFGADFSDVRVHTGRDAVQMNRDVGAHAFTHASDIYFGAGHSPSNLALTAHDLTHVVQQSGGINEVGRRSPNIADGRGSGDVALMRQAAAPPPAAPAAPAPASSGTREKIDRALKSGQYLDVAEISDFGPATDAERISLSRICISGGYVAPQDATSKVHLIWSGMVERLPNVVESNVSDWESATKFCPRLLLLPPVVKARDDFQAVLNSVATNNLQENLQFVQNRKQLLGLGEEQQPLSPPEQTKLRQSIQKIAWHAWELRQKQKAQREMVVGYANQNLGFGVTEWHFNPGQPPPVRETLFSTPPHQHESVKEAWDEAENEITGLGNDYPEIYAAAMADEDGSALLHLSRVTSEHFGENVKQQLLTLENNIKDVQAMIADGRLNLLDLGVLHQAIFQGAGAAAGHNWAAGFDQWVAKKLISERKQGKEAVRSLLKGVETVALIVGTFAGGLGRFVALGVAAGAQAFMAGQDIAEASRQQQAARATPLKGTALVSRVEADALKAEGIVKLVQAMMTALMAVGAGASALRTARLEALVSDPALLARLRALANDDAVLERLLRKTNNPEALETLLKQAGSAAKAEEMLGTGGIDFSKQLSSAGDKGSLAGRGQGFGVFEGRVPGVAEPVAIKVFPKSEEAYFLNEMRSAELASTTSRGPRFYGRVEAGEDKLAFAMEKVAGEFVDPTTKLSVAARESVTAQTAQDVRDFGREILERGRYSQGDVQGLVDKGRWRPIDFGSYKELPNQATDPVGYADAIRAHNNAVNAEAEMLDKIAKENATRPPGG